MYMYTFLTIVIRTSVIFPGALVETYTQEKH